MRGREKEREYKVVFWNVAGLGNKGRDFWKEVKEWHIIIMSEMWLEKKGWEGVRDFVPRGFK